MTSDTNTLIDKNMFLESNIESQIDYLNERLSEGVSVAEIRNELRLGEKKLQKILKENAYKYNQKTKQYESSLKVSYTPTTKVNLKKNDMPGPIENNKNQFMLKLLNEIEELKTMNTKVVELYSWYENQKNVVEPIQLIIECRDDVSTTVKSYKIYSETEKNFQDLCKKYSHLKVQDLISKALDEFIVKYK